MPGCVRGGMQHILVPHQGKLVSSASSNEAHHKPDQVLFHHAQLKINEGQAHSFNRMWWQERAITFFCGETGIRANAEWPGG